MPMITPAPPLQRRQQEYFPFIAPLTTTFTPASSCTNFVDGAWGHICAFENNGLLPDPACFPAVSTTQVYTYSGYEDNGQMGYFSPGLVCPAGWSTVCIGGAATDLAQLPGGVPTSSIITGASFANPPRPGESVAGCCPSGFSWTSGAVCSSRADPSAIILQTFCGPSETHDPSFYGSTTVTPTTIESAPVSDLTGEFLNYGESGGLFVTQTTTGIGNLFYADLIQLNWQASDLPSAKHGTPAGVIAGAVVGGVIGLLLLVIVPVVLLRMRRRKKSRKSQVIEKAELPADNEPSMTSPRVDRPFSEMPIREEEVAANKTGTADNGPVHELA